MSGLRGQDNDPAATDDVDLDALIGEEPDDPDPEPDDNPEEVATDSVPQPGDPPEPQPGAQETQQRQRQPSRAEARIRALTQEIDEERRRRQQLEQQLSQARTPPPQAPDPNAERERERQEIERIAFVAQSQGQDPTGAIARYYSEQSEKRIREALQLSELRTADAMDRQTFLAIQREEAIARRLSPRVEEELTKLRRLGINPTREQILDLLVGQEVRQKAKKQIESQRRRGAQQIAAQTTQPAQTRSTAQPERNRREDNSIEAVEKRLENVIL